MTHHSLLTLYSSFISSAFPFFRLTFIPLFVLSHSEHGGIWLNALLGLLLTFGGEWLARRKRAQFGTRRQNLAVVILALLFLGLFPEEGHVGLILWLGIGLAWGERSRQRAFLPQTNAEWLSAATGAFLGLSGLVGPGSWLMAFLLLPLFWQPDPQSREPHKSTPEQ
jgi:hypothetical protein